MKRKSIAVNAFLNGLRSLLNILFPLITFPYISRKLTVEGIGIYNFSNSIVSYFLMIAALGISNYAIREGAKYRNNKDKIIPVKLVLEPADLLAEKSLIKIMLKDRKNFGKIKSYLMPNDFIDDECRELARIIYDIYNNEDHINAISENDLIEPLENINGIDMGKIKEILEMNINISLDEKNKAIEDLIETVKYSKLKIRRKEIAEEIHNIDSKKGKDEGDVERFKRLCLELAEIDKELKLHQ